MPKAQKLDAATKKQAIAFAQKHIEFFGGGLDRKLWRAARKQELCGQLELPNEVWREFAEISDQLYLKPRFEPDKPPLDLYRRAIRIQGVLLALFEETPWTWNDAAAARLIADAKQGNADADQVLIEVLAEYLKRHELPPKPLADYAARALPAHFSRTKPTRRSLKRSSDGHLALVVYAVCQKFSLNPKRGRHSKNDWDCGCSIVAKAINSSSESKLSTVEKAWDKNKEFIRSSAARDLVAEFLELEHDLDQMLAGKIISDRQATTTKHRRLVVG